MCFMGCFWKHGLMRVVEFAVMVVATYVIGPEVADFADQVFGVTAETLGETGYAAFNGVVSQFVSSSITATPGRAISSPTARSSPSASPSTATPP
jgi:hypothetical protein